MPKLRDLWLHEFRLGADTLKEIEKVLNARRGTLYNRDAPLRESEPR
jgi:hypothetical protein